ncbi:MAG: hypothetical protein M3168_06625 [Actinomycetota bacterium]|nr:hypothetical protein [Actinomycetota bacterium]
MSTSRRTRLQREDDRIVSVLSHWLAGHAGDDELLRTVEDADRARLEPEQVEAIDELLSELHAGRGRGEVERAVRETLEALALG